jgi:hypothetical protein
LTLRIPAAFLLDSPVRCSPLHIARFPISCKHADFRYLLAQRPTKPGRSFLFFGTLSVFRSSLCRAPDREGDSSQPQSSPQPQSSRQPQSNPILISASSLAPC